MRPRRRIHICLNRLGVQDVLQHRIDRRGGGWQHQKGDQLGQFPHAGWRDSDASGQPQFVAWGGGRCGRDSDNIPQGWSFPVFEQQCGQPTVEDEEPRVREEMRAREAPSFLRLPELSRKHLRPASK